MSDKRCRPLDDFGLIWSYSFCLGVILPLLLNCEGQAALISIKRFPLWNRWPSFVIGLPVSASGLSKNL